MRNNSAEWIAQRPDTRGADIDRELRAIADEPVIDRYKPAFLGEGGEHVVFEIPNHPRFVVKVQRKYLEKIVRHNTAIGLAVDAVAPDVQKSVETILEKNRQAHSLMREYFGDSVLREFQYFIPIPLTTSLLRVLAGDHIPELPEGIANVSAFVRVQEKIPQVAVAYGISLTFNYMEPSGKVSDEEYVRLNADAENAEDAERYLMLALENPEFVEVLKHDNALRTVIRAFVENAVRYTEETGEMLDMAGTSNVVCYKGEAGWHVVLPDAMYPVRDAWSDVRDASDYFLRAGELDRHQANRLMNGLNYARLINALAEMVGSPSHLHVSSKSLTGRFAELRKVIHDAHRQS